MKFTIWERNNIYTMVGSVKLSNARHLELIQTLRKKFVIDDEKDWERYSRLSALNDHQISEEQRDFLKDYSEEIHSSEVDIKLTKAEFKYISDYITSDRVNLPAREDIIDKSIAFVNKMKNKQEEAEEI